MSVLPSVTIPGNTTYGGFVMNPGIQVGAPLGGSIVMPQTTMQTATTLAAPTYTTSYASPAPVVTSYAEAPTYTTAPQIVETVQAAPMTTYTSALPTTASMVAYPQAQNYGPFTFYAVDNAPVAPSAPAKRDATVAKKKGAKKKKSCGCC